MGKVKKGREGSCLDILDYLVSCPLRVVTPGHFCFVQPLPFPCWALVQASHNVTRTVREEESGVG